MGERRGTAKCQGEGQVRPDRLVLLLEAPSFVRPAPRASSVPTTENRSRSRAGAVKAGSAARGHPSGLGLDWPKHGGKIGWSGTEPAVSNFKPVVFDHFCAAANTKRTELLRLMAASRRRQFAEGSITNKPGPSVGKEGALESE